MIIRWIIFGFIVLSSTPVNGQIALPTSVLVDSLRHALDSTSSPHQVQQIADELLHLMDTLEKSSSLNERNYDESAKQKQEIEALKQEKKINHLSNYFIISLLMLALMISSFFFVRNRMKRKLAESELLNQRLIAQQFHRELQGKRKDLTNLALEIARKNELFTNTNKILKETKLESLAVNQRKKIQQLIQFNDNQLRINQDLEELFVNIEQVNADFFERLNQIAPELTASEKQICALLRLNLSNKEIASIRNISPKSGEMARYRLRKKLPIQAGDDIYTFIQNI